MIVFCSHGKTSIISIAISNKVLTNISTLVSLTSSDNYGKYTINVERKLS